MQTEPFIPADTVCEYYKIEISFIDSLQEYGLLEINTIDEKKFIPNDKIDELEKFIHLHYDLDINIAGIDAISNLLKRMKDLQDEIASLKSKLKMYE